MSGGSGRLPPPAALCPPPPLHGPSLPEAGARSQGRGSPAGHGAPRGAPGSRAPPPGEQESGPGGLGAGPGVPPPAGSAAGPQGRGVALRGARGPYRLGATGGTGREGGQTLAVRSTARRIAAAAGGRPCVAWPAAECSGPSLNRCPARRWLFPRRSVGMQRCEARATRSAGAREGASGCGAAAAGAPQPRAPCPPVQLQGLRRAGQRVPVSYRTLMCPGQRWGLGGSAALPPLRSGRRPSADCRLSPAPGKDFSVCECVCEREGGGDVSVSVPGVRLHPSQRAAGDCGNSRSAVTGHTKFFRGAPKC